MKLLKKILIVVTLLFTVSLVLLFLFIREMESNFTYGTDVEYKNELGVTIDSLQLSICETKTIVLLYSQYFYNNFTTNLM